MATKRRYSDGCAAAHALDLIGERWALLVVRELLLGPKRFTNLRAGMPGASPNMLAQRLRDLEEVGIVRRRELGPPVSAQIYELTEWGNDLDAVLISLGRWGARSPLLDRTAERSVDSLMLSLRALFSPAAVGSLNAVYALRIGVDRFSIRVCDGALDMARGDPADPDAVIDTDVVTFGNVVARREALDSAMNRGAVQISGDVTLVQRLVDTFRRAEPALLP